MDDEEVKAYLDDRVHKLQVDWLLGLGEERSQRVEERLQAHPDELAEGRAKQAGLQLRGNVRIYHVLALILECVQEKY